jgi:hypothetical protein
MIIKRFIDVSFFWVLGVGSADFSVDSVDETVLENVDRDFVAFALGEFAVAHFGKQKAFDWDDFFANNIVHVVAFALAGCEVDGFVENSVIERYLASGLVNFNHTVINVELSIKENHPNSMHFGFEPAPRDLSRLDLHCQGSGNVIIIFQIAMIFLNVEVFVSRVD